jgi:predicted nucleotidyltransferase
MRPAVVSERFELPGGWLFGLDSVRPIGDDVTVVVVNEKSRVPPVDAAARERLARALDRDGVVAAMLIGSQARGTPGLLSDVDIAVWHEPGLDSARRFGLQLDLIAAAEAALGTSEIDLVMLNGAPPLFRHRAIRDAKRLVERDERLRVRFEARSLIDFLDTEPLRAEMSSALRKRIEEDRFGRP